ncbi:MAG: UDP-N-acetylmuramate dehydrogenase [Aestuariivita sp.]|nr:UDP-N-acetylmuramate dehydrogenase [Aestuariivita sp.]
MVFPEQLPESKGLFFSQKKLADLTWLRVGGTADGLFLPSDLEDLVHFVSNLDPDIDLFPLGVGSNLIIRDRGIAAIVIRLGRKFNQIRIDGKAVTAGAAALVSHVARKSAEQGLDLGFLRTIPGTIGGALRMNAGCYGRSFSDVFQSAKIISRSGEITSIDAQELNFGYRQSVLPADAIVLEVKLKGKFDDPYAIKNRMDIQINKRNKTQPIKECCAGSVFRNPSGSSSTGEPNDSHSLKAWKLIDDVGMRGEKLGGAQISEIHPNFLINAGNATADDLERLGNKVRDRVYDFHGIDLQWEILRVGRSMI